MASRGVNKVIIIGRLGHDPEIRYSPSGTAFANLTVATSEQWRDKKTGEQKEQTEWHRVVMSGKLAGSKRTGSVHYRGHRGRWWNHANAWWQARRQ